jgi:ATP/maltotriose-dependent transcriptional regulator MalT
MSFNIETLNKSKDLDLLPCDRCILEALRPHLTQFTKEDFEPNDLHRIVAQFKNTLENSAVISLSLDGQVKHITKSAEKLLQQYFSFQTSTPLPEVLEKWFEAQLWQLSFHNIGCSQCFSTHIEQGDRQLVMRLIGDPQRKHFLLLLAENRPLPLSIDALELLGLTKREAEVLFWVAHDESNSGIAKLLGCCKGTVRKHLENIYKKLQVQTRTGALMVALNRLGLLTSTCISESS